MGGIWAGLHPSWPRVGASEHFLLGLAARLINRHTDRRNQALGATFLDITLAVWPSYRPLEDRWGLEELFYRGERAPQWRNYHAPHGSAHHPDEATAKSAADKLNHDLRAAFDARQMDPRLKTSLRLKVLKRVHAKARLADEEKHMLAEGQRRHRAATHIDPAELKLSDASARFRDELARQLSEMPYLEMALVGAPGSRHVIYRRSDGVWSKPYWASERSAAQAVRARIANGFDFSAKDHWGLVKAAIRKILLPGARPVLGDPRFQACLADALAEGTRVLVWNDIVFWYEEDGSSWQEKRSAARKGVGPILWREGTIVSVNHGRIVVLPYIKEDGTKVHGHTRNAAGEGPSKPRHPGRHLNIPFKRLKDDQTFDLRGTLHYE